MWIFLLRELQLPLTGVLSEAVQFFKEESSNLLVGSAGELLARPEKGLKGPTGQHADLSLILFTLHPPPYLVFSSPILFLFSFSKENNLLLPTG